MESKLAYNLYNREKEFIKTLRLTGYSVSRSCGETYMKEIIEQVLLEEF